MPSFLTAILGLALVAQSQAHVSLISIYGSNKVVGHAFGVDLNGRYPRVLGAPGDAGGDSGIFETGTDTPSPACGSTPELGPLDLSAWLDQAEGFGLPAAYSNMSVVIEAFQVNRDGGGPMMCEYNDDATATSWKPMSMSLNQAGNSGIQNQQRVNSTVVANFPQNATCNGGFTQTACIVRCRTGVNRRFGGCFAVKLSDSVPFAVRVANSTDIGLNNTISRAVGDPTSNCSGALSNEALDQIAEKIVSAMQTSGFLISAAAIVSLGNSTSSVTNSSSGVISRLVDGSQAASNTSLPVPVPAGSANTTTPTYDASDAADAADASNGTDPSTASDAADASNGTDPTTASDASDASEDDTSDASDAADASTDDTANTTSPSDASDAADGAQPADSDETSDTTDASDAADATTTDADSTASADTDSTASADADTAASDAATPDQPASSRSKRHLRNTLSKRFKASLRT